MSLQTGLLSPFLFPPGWPGIWASPSTSQKEGPLCAAAGSPPTPADTPAVYSTRADAADRDGEAVSPTGRYPWKSHDESHGAVAAVSPYGAAEWLLQDKNLSLTPHLRQAVAFNSREFSQDKSKPPTGVTERSREQQMRSGFGGGRETPGSHRGHNVRTGSRGDPGRAQQLGSRGRTEVLRESEEEPGAVQPAFFLSWSRNL
ncbi:uncharacterized protein LOC128312396 [Acinonyx jubatus]|uniref:Uncharacterized protein LOC128312396 n=1 Tax=Acinonyx jubatus TaxID=32536 RepID=A0ABM3NRF7_ACIJB|nr:uncharacterized protein LOC128312396 [Acinonyx jubatus]